VLKRISLFSAVTFSVANLAVAQTNIDLGGMTVDTTAGIEVTADSLSVDQDTGSAVFVGNVVVMQGDLLLSAGTVEVIYATETNEISRLNAAEGVTFVTATQATESQNAQYDITTGLLTLSGDVLLTQGASAISAQTMVINVADGTATMEGRVRTILQQGDN